jgi:hypothetical protein
MAKKATPTPRKTSPHRSTVPNSTGAMRDFLLTQMVAVVDGRQDHPTARSVCGYAQQVYNLLNIELKAANMLAKRGTMDMQSIEFEK